MPKGRTSNEDLKIKAENIKRRAKNGESFRQIAQAENVGNLTIKKALNGDYDNLDTSNKTTHKKTAGPGSTKKKSDKLANKDQSDGLSPEEKKAKLKKELDILIKCLGFGHKEYLKFKEYNIRNSVELNTRINEIIRLL